MKNFSIQTSNLIAGIVFGSIGFAAFIYGKKQSSFKAMMIAMALMVYPYFVSNTVWVTAIGIALTAALFIFRD